MNIKTKHVKTCQKNVFVHQRNQQNQKNRKTVMKKVHSYTTPGEQHKHPTLREEICLNVKKTLFRESVEVRM